MNTIAWSLRRELWESRSVVIAPLIVAAVVLFGSMMSTLTLPKRLRAAAGDPAAVARAVTPFKMAPAPIMLATFIVGFFYSIDALYGERRDRSILFWKSLPVSDRTTVLSKAAIPIVVLPLIAYALSVIVQLLLLLGGTVLLVTRGMSPVPIWAEVRFFQSLVIMIYGLAVHALWFAPINGWLIVVSAWARRVPMLWAALPPFVIGIAEHLTTRTTRFGSFIRYRFMGAMQEAFGGSQDGHVDGISQLSPLKFVTASGLWLGLAFTAACLAAAVRLRRYREPI